MTRLAMSAFSYRWFVVVFLMAFGCSSKEAVPVPTLADLASKYGPLPVNVRLLGSTQNAVEKAVSSETDTPITGPRLWVLFSNEPFLLPFSRTLPAHPVPSASEAFHLSPDDLRTVVTARDAFPATTIGTVLSACGMENNETLTGPSSSGHSYSWNQDQMTWHVRELQVEKGWLTVVENF